MRQNQQDNEHRNIIREQILRKGYAHQYDIRRFIPCGREKANQILAQEMLEAEREGKSTITGISANRLPKYVGLTKEELNKAELGIIKELYELYGGRMMVVASREASTYEKYSLYYMKELMKTWVMKGYSAEDVENGKR